MKNLNRSTTFLFLFLCIASTAFYSCETDISTLNSKEEYSPLKDGLDLTASSQEDGDHTTTLPQDCDGCELRLYKITGITAEEWLPGITTLTIGSGSDEPFYRLWLSTQFGSSGDIEWADIQNPWSNIFPTDWISEETYPRIFEHMLLNHSFVTSIAENITFTFQVRCPSVYSAAGEIIAYENAFVQRKVSDFSLAPNGLFYINEDIISKPCPPGGIQIEGPNDDTILSNG